MKRKLSDSMIQRIVNEYFECRSPKLIQKKYGIIKSTLYNWVREMRQVKRSKYRSVTAAQIYRMERRLKTLQEENQIYKESGCSITDPIDKKMAAIERLKGRYSIHALCRTLRLAKGTYYNRTLRKVPKTVFEQTNDTLRPLIAQFFEESKADLVQKRSVSNCLNAGKESQKSIFRRS